MTHATESAEHDERSEARWARSAASNPKLTSRPPGGTVNRSRAAIKGANMVVRLQHFLYMYPETPAYICTCVLRPSYIGGWRRAVLGFGLRVKG